MSISSSIPLPILTRPSIPNPPAPKPSLILPHHQKRPTTQDLDSAAGVKRHKRKLVGTVDYDRGERRAKVQVAGVRRDAIPARYELRVDATRFQKDWNVSEVVERVVRLRRWEDIDGVLNSWIGRFARNNFSLLIRDHAIQLFPRCAVVIHHGGRGFTAAALHAGTPQIVCPFLLDQFYWAERLFWLGVAPEPLQKDHLVPDSEDARSLKQAAVALSTAIKHALSPEIRDQAA